MLQGSRCRWRPTLQSLNPAGVPRSLGGLFLMSEVPLYTQLIIEVEQQKNIPFDQGFFGIAAAGEWQLL